MVNFAVYLLNPFQVTSKLWTPCYCFLKFPHFPWENLTLNDALKFLCLNFIEWSHLFSDHVVESDYEKVIGEAGISAII